LDQNGAGSSGGRGSPKGASTPNYHPMREVVELQQLRMS
jgi:hypothetical protein